MTICNYFNILNETIIEGLNIIFSIYDAGPIYADNFLSSSLNINRDILLYMDRESVYRKILEDFSDLNELNIKVDAEFSSGNGLLIFRKSVLYINTFNVLDDRVSPDKLFIGLTNHIMIRYDILDDIYKIDDGGGMEKDIANIQCIIDSIHSIDQEILKLNLIKNNQTIMNFRCLKHDFSMTDLINDNLDMFRSEKNKLATRLMEINNLNIEFSKSIKLKISGILEKMPESIKNDFFTPI